MKYIEKLNDAQVIDPGQRLIETMAEVMLEHDATLPINFIKRWWLRRRRAHILGLLNKMQDLGMFGDRATPPGYTVVTSKDVAPGDFVYIADAQPTYKPAPAPRTAPRTSPPQPGDLG